ncbi:bacillithiol biosynthesis cysteine-adding enzyme BshC [Cohnella massiliensis]|uniref:bacillithiol biosynthesis cysteine-adding enzyme BshC n=1 Tax=Cohnella massiliensis TaxID=1816691 RepID=UPI0009B93992|nr:bacillithiol biosynthesis cysteine-adding enzyme BshC [Cohnella massiliensis]
MNLTPLDGLSSPSLAELYRRQDERVRGLFGSHPSAEGDWRRRAAALDATARRRADRKLVAGAIREYHARLPAFEAVARSLAKLESSDSLVVVGGQQAGLFGGPLMIVYKALTVIETARHAERLLGRPVVPVFWIAGEDHDFDEANHVFVAAAGGELARIRMERPEGARHSVSRTPLGGQEWEAALEALSAALPDTEFKPGLLERLRKHVSDEPTLTLAFARLLADWFGPSGLLLLDADDPNLRALEGPFFRELIERNDELEHALREGEGAVRELGFPLQAESSPGCANVFVHLESGRTLLFKKDGRFSDKKEEAFFSKDELLDMADGGSTRLSNNALTRPMMQEYLLPVLGTVLGHAEIAYWSSLGAAFKRFGMSMPIIVPRQSFTFLEPNIRKLLDKYEITAEEVIREGESRKEKWLAEQDRWQLDAKFADVRDRFAELYAPILDTMSALQPALRKLGESNQDKIFEQIAYLEKRASDALAKQHEAGLRQWDRMRGSLAPQDKLQERVLGSIHFLNRYGPDWLAGWHQVPFEATGGHRLVENLISEALV